MPLHQVIVLSKLDFATIEHVEWHKVAHLILLTDGSVGILQTQQLMTIQHQYPRLQIDIRLCQHPLNFMYLLGRLSERFADVDIWLQPNLLVTYGIEQLHDWDYAKLNIAPSVAPVSQKIDTKMKLVLERYNNNAPYDPLQHSQPVNTVLDEQIVN